MPWTGNEAVVLRIAGEPYSEASASRSRDRLEDWAGEIDSAADEDVRGRFTALSVPWTCSSGAGIEKEAEGDWGCETPEEEVGREPPLAVTLLLLGCVGASRGSISFAVIPRRCPVGVFHCLFAPAPDCSVDIGVTTACVEAAEVSILVLMDGGARAFAPG
jgi:hypothetical protein